MKKVSTSLSACFLFFALAAIASQNPNPNQLKNTDATNPTIRFQEYLRINTAHPNPDYASAASYLISQAQSIGLNTLTLEFVSGKPLLLFSWPGKDSSLPSILLNSHMDSVPVEATKWTHMPFAATVNSEGKIFARGAQDDKCVGIQYLEALRVLKEDREFSPLRTIHLSFVPDEEIGGFDGMAKFAASEEFRELNVGFVLDEGQASEGDEFMVFYGDRVPWNLIVRAEGRPGHGSNMYHGSALENLMRTMEAVSRFRESQFDKVKAGFAAPAEVVSVNQVYAKAGMPTPMGFVMKLQPSEAEAGFDIRLPPTSDPDFIKRKISDEWAPAAWNMTYQLIEKGPLRDYKGRPLMTSTDESNPWWLVFKHAVAAAGGKLATPEIILSTTDARYMRQIGIPTLGFSPMVNTPVLFHEHNEYLNEKVYLNGIKIYETVIRSLISCLRCSEQA